MGSWLDVSGNQAGRLPDVKQQVYQQYKRLDKGLLLRKRFSGCCDHQCGDHRQLELCYQLH